MSIKAYSTQKKLTKKLEPYTEAEYTDSSQFITAQKTSSNKIGLDTVQNGVYRTTGTAKVAEAGSTDSKRVLICTAHGAKPGDVVRFEQTAANPGFESNIISIPDANTIILAAELDQNIVVGDEFFILRYVTPLYDENGASLTTSGPIQFIKDAVITTVEQDTGTPGASTPLPVLNLDQNGDPVDFATSALQTAGNVLIGAVNEAAPAADTDPSGLNGRLQRVAQRLTSLISLFPTSLGQKADAASLAVTISTEGTAQLGALTETAPATDTASSGLNGRLQRIAQRLTSLISLLPISLGQKTKAASLAVTLASDEDLLSRLPATLGQKASASSLAVALSTEQEGLIGALNETAPATDTASSGLNGRLQRIAQNITSLISLLPISLGQKTMAGSLAVVLASDQSAVPTISAGKTAINKVRNDYSSVNVTTAAYVELLSAAQFTTACTEVEIFDSSGQTLLLATGGAGSEADQVYIIPGGNGRIPLAIAASTRISVKAVSATASVGELTINFFG